MRTVQQPDSEQFGKAPAANSKASDETAYLLSSKANAKRLLKSIANLRARTTDTGKPNVLTESPPL